MKNFAGDIIILHMCTKNHNCPPPIPMDPENQDFEKMKKWPEDIILN